MSPYNSDGVDVTLVRWMLSLTPCERLQVLEDQLGFIWEAIGDDARQQIIRDHSHAG